MNIISQLEDEIYVLKRQLEDEKSARNELELFKEAKLVELKRLTEEAIQKTKNKFLEEIEILKNEKRELLLQLDIKEKENRRLLGGTRVLDGSENLRYYLIAINK